MIPKVEARFWKYVDRRGDDECWIWKGSTCWGGYGKFWYGRDIRAHRFSYELVKGSIPDGLTIDHLCKNHLCVNPRHLEAVSFKENILRGNSFSAILARQTHCKNGHPLSGNNLYRYPDGRRECRICHRASMRKWRNNNRTTGDLT